MGTLELYALFLERRGNLCQDNIKVTGDCPQRQRVFLITSRTTDLNVRVSKEVRKNNDEEPTGEPRLDGAKARISPVLPFSALFFSSKPFAKRSHPDQTVICWGVGLVHSRGTEATGQSSNGTEAPTQGEHANSKRTGQEPDLNPNPGGVR